MSIENVWSVFRGTLTAADSLSLHIYRIIDLNMNSSQKMILEKCWELPSEWNKQSSTKPTFFFSN